MSKGLIDIRQVKFLQGYLDPKSPTLGNASKSAQAAGYTKEYADHITDLMPKWLEKRIGRYEKMVEKAEKNLETFLDMPLEIEKKEDGHYVIRIDPALVKIKQDTSKFVVERLNKKEWNDKKEIEHSGGVQVTEFIIDQ